MHDAHAVQPAQGLGHLALCAQDGRHVGAPLEVGGLREEPALVHGSLQGGRKRPAQPDIPASCRAELVIGLCLHYSVCTLQPYCARLCHVRAQECCAGESERAQYLNACCNECSLSSKHCAQSAQQRLVLQAVQEQQWSVFLHGQDLLSLPLTSRLPLVASS